MKDQHKFSFKIDSLTPEDLSMKRLGEYITNLAQLLGSEEHVHVVGIESGSVDLVVGIDRYHEEEVMQRVRNASQGEGPQQANDAFQKIGKDLRKDKSEGRLFDPRGKEVTDFSEWLRSNQEEFGPFEQEDSFDGVVMRVGGKKELVPVLLQSGDDEISCLASRNMAKKLANYLFEKELRVFGTGRCRRDTDGKWRFNRFVIADFEVLDTTPLTTLVERLRSVPGNGWEKLEDPWGELKRDRED
ncbi:MAG: hypothetical protein OXF09_05005 [Hyphomicrobiales bacterium]|nr:hypothetical protein [Hyphomicrobiales bacterium]